MKRKILALSLVLAMILGLGLTACGGNEPAALAGPDEVAVALFDLLLKNDASGAQKALGYESEDAVRADFGTEGGELYEIIADQLIDEFEGMGVTVSPEDSQLLVDAMMTMMGKLQLTAKVKDISEKDKEATVTCTVTKVNVNDAMESAMESAISDPSLANDMDALVSAIIRATADAMKSAETGDASEPFDVDFTLEVVETNGKPQRVWIPADAEAFGAAISSAAMNG